MKRLNERQRAFVRAFLGEARENASEAARIAGYKHPPQQGHKLLNNPLVKAEIDRVNGVVVSDSEVMDRIELCRWWSHVVRTGERPVTRKLERQDFPNDDLYQSYLRGLRVDSMKASENLAKSLGLFNHDQKHSIEADGVKLELVIPRNGSEIE